MEKDGTALAVTTPKDKIYFKKVAWDFKYDSRNRILPRQKHIRLMELRENTTGQNVHWSNKRRAKWIYEEILSVFALHSLLPSPFIRWLPVEPAIRAHWKRCRRRH